MPAITTCLGEDADASRATSICGREDGDRDNWTRKAFDGFLGHPRPILVIKKPRESRKIKSGNRVGRRFGPVKVSLGF